MNIEKMDLNLLKVFIAIYEEQKLTVASDRLGLTQPALSHALKRLRDILDDDLFQRTPRGMQATRSAHEFYDRIKPGMTALEQGFSKKQNFDPATSDKTYTLGMNDYGATILLPPLLRHLTRLAPKVRLRTRHYAHGSQYDDLSSGAIDLSITIEDDHPHWTDQELLFTESAIGVCDIDNQAFGRKVDLKAYATADHVTMSADGSGRSWVDDYLVGQDMSREITHSVPYFAAVGAIIQHTQMISTLPKRVAKNMLAPYGLKTFNLPFKPPPHKIIQLWHRRNQNEAANKWLREQISCVATFL